MRTEEWAMGANGRFAELYERHFREILAYCLRRGPADDGYDAVLEAASHLNARDREVLDLAAWEGLPHREIAEILGCSIAAVDQRLHTSRSTRSQVRATERWYSTTTPARKATTGSPSNGTTPPGRRRCG